VSDSSSSSSSRFTSASSLHDFSISPTTTIFQSNALSWVYSQTFPLSKKVTEGRKSIAEIEDEEDRGKEYQAWLHSMLLLAYYYRIIFYALEYSRHSQKFSVVVKFMTSPSSSSFAGETTRDEEERLGSSLFQAMFQQLEATEDKFLCVYLLDILTSLAIESEGKNKRKASRDVGLLYNEALYTLYPSENYELLKHLPFEYAFFNHPQSLTTSSFQVAIKSQNGKKGLEEKGVVTSSNFSTTYPKYMLHSMFGLLPAPLIYVW
jgi:hypothetical protein